MPGQRLLGDVLCPLSSNDPCPSHVQNHSFPRPLLDSLVYITVRSISVQMRWGQKRLGCGSLKCRYYTGVLLGLLLPAGHTVNEEADGG